MNARGKRTIPWPVSTGVQNLSVDVKQAVNVSPRPRLVIKANPAIGVNADVEGVAAAGSGWVTIGPLAVNPTSPGVLEIVMETRYDAQHGSAPCFWDNLVAA